MDWLAGDLIKVWRGITNIIVILSTQVDSRDVHSTVIRPVVCERDDKLNAHLLCNLNNLVECL